MSPWLITSFSLAAGQRLIAMVLRLRQHRVGALMVTLALATAILAAQAVAQARRRSASRKRSTS